MEKRRVEWMIRHERWQARAFDRWYSGDRLIRWHRVLGVFLILTGLSVMLGFRQYAMGLPPLDCLMSLGLEPYFCR